MAHHFVLQPLAQQLVQLVNGSLLLLAPLRVVDAAPTGAVEKLRDTAGNLAQLGEGDEPAHRAVLLLLRQVARFLGESVTEAVNGRVVNGRRVCKVDVCVLHTERASQSDGHEAGFSTGLGPTLTAQDRRQPTMRGHQVA